MIGAKIYGRISSFMPIVVVSPNSIENSSKKLPSTPPKVIFINQIDIDQTESEILHYLRQRYQEAKIIALNTHSVPILKDRTIASGYDGYLSLFEMGDKLSGLLESFGLDTSYARNSVDESQA